MSLAQEAVGLNPAQRKMVALIEQRFTEAGWSSDVTAAAVVNATAESGLDPKAIDASGKCVGLFQLNIDGAGAGLSVEARQNPETNIRVILVKEMKKRGQRIEDAAEQGADVAELSAMFCKLIERPSNVEKRCAARANRARKLFPSRCNQPEAEVGASSWEEIKSYWGKQWDDLEATAREYADTVVEAPEKYRAKVTAFLAAMEQSRKNMGEIVRKLNTEYDGKFKKQYGANLNEMVRVYNAICAGLHTETVGYILEPAVELELGVAPILVIGAVGFTAVGVAWAVVMYERAMALRDASGVQLADLNARVEAMRANKTLQDATTPTTPAGGGAPGQPPGPGGPPKDPWDYIPYAIAGGLGIVALAFSVPLFSRRS